MKRSILVSITEVSRGITTKVDVIEDGKRVTSKSSTRLWGSETRKSPDHLLLEQVFGALNHELRQWMDQGELPF
uniref:Uncharacterized protein n=1 Tax=uncultured prokaryote TaxID=198431 RepID=A0A0H5Q7D3_9ZZZZ|nr:hypothetical protein [uncultured prokaryote]